jgi:SAM-dependent methyltransferase
MGQLFIQEINLFEELVRKIKLENKKVALVEVGMGTAEL